MWCRIPCVTSRSVPTTGLMTSLCQLLAPTQNGLKCDGWTTGVRFSATAMSRPALGSTQPPTQRVPGLFSRGMKLTTHILQVPRLRMRGAIPPLLPTSSWRCAWLNTGTALPVPYWTGKLRQKCEVPPPGVQCSSRVSLAGTVVLLAEELAWRSRDTNVFSKWVQDIAVSDGRPPDTAMSWQANVAPCLVKFGTSPLGGTAMQRQSCPCA